ncbi:MAG: N5-glutamine methyltransferase family protein, partial [Nitrospinaceae bacterium]
TELLVEEFLRRVRPGGEQPGITVLDLCTGSGAVAVAVTRELPACRVVGADICGQALKVARRNAVRLGVEAKSRWVQSDLYSGLSAGGHAPASFDFILCNPPYLSRREWEALAPDIRGFEPAGALDGGPDGLDFYPRITAGALYWLKPEGWLMMEIGAGQGDAVRRLTEARRGYGPTTIRRDHSGRDRVVVVQKARQESHG